MILCDKMINATDSVSKNIINISKNIINTIPTNMTNIISTNVASTVSINSDDKKVRYKTDCYILHTVLLGIILLFIIIIIFCNYAKHMSKQILLAH